MDGTMAERVRAEVWRGASLLNFLSFAVILALITALMAWIIAIAPGWFWALSALGTETTLWPEGGTLAQDAEWLRSVSNRWSAVRSQMPWDGRLFATLGVIWAMMVAFGLLLQHRPCGCSALKNDRYRDGAVRLLDRFGYFKDIRILTSAEERVFQFGREIFFPLSMMRKLNNCAANNLVESMLFLMAHEYVHSVARENILRSLIQVLFVFFAISGFVLLIQPIFFGAMLIAPFLHAPMVFWLIVGAATIIMSASLVLPVWGFFACHARSREFFADRIARNVTGSASSPYEKGEIPLSILCAWSGRVSTAEHRSHVQGYGPYIRNSLPFALVLHGVLRTAYLLICPADQDVWIVAFDLPFLVALVVLWTTLPSRPPEMLPEVTPWAVSTLAFGTLILSVGTPALPQMLLGVSLVSPEWMILASAPLLVAFGATGVVTLWNAMRALRSGPGARGPSVRQSMVLLGLMAMTLPGHAFSALVFLVVLSLSSAMLYAVVDTIGWSSGPLWSTRFFVGLVFLAVASSCLFLLYRGVLVPLRRGSSAPARLAVIAEVVLVVVVTTAIVPFLVNILMAFVEAGGGTMVELQTFIAAHPSAGVAGGAGWTVLAWMLVVYGFAKLLQWGASYKLFRCIGGN